MIHAHIDTVEHRKIIGFETGTRAQFDQRHGGDPLWIFVDSYKVKYRINFVNFITRPFDYMIDELGDLRLSDEPPIIIVEEDPVIPVGYQAITGRDNRVLKGEDGLYLYGPLEGYESPPEDMVYLLDSDNMFLSDPDGKFLIEPL